MAWHDQEGRLSDPTAEEFKKWVCPKEAFAHFPDGLAPAPLVGSLLKRLRDESLFAAAESARWRSSGRAHGRRLVSIDSSWWIDAHGAESYQSPLWMDGEVTCRITDDEDEDEDWVSVNFYGVKFEYDGLYDAVPGLRTSRLIENLPKIAHRPTAADLVIPPRPTAINRSPHDAVRIAELEKALASALAMTKPHAGGAPPKPWWDDLWVEMFRQIWQAELQPTAMAHIAEAMQQWAVNNGHELSEATAKRAARKLWSVAKPEGS